MSPGITRAPGSAVINSNYALVNLDRDELLSPQEEEYANHKGKLEEDGKPSVKGRIRKVLNCKDKDDLNEREWTFNLTVSTSKMI